MKPKLSLYISIAATILCSVLIFKVNVNSDMTKYLPDGSQMRQGLEIIQDEFGLSPASVGSVRIMTGRLDSASCAKVRASLLERPEVISVSDSHSSTLTAGSEGGYTLLELGVVPGTDLKALAKELAKDFSKDTVIGTSLDGATPNPLILIIGIIILVVILLVMTKSWLEPVLLMIATGMAVIVNMGTNAFLESVSITTNSIAAILQLVLSIDYSVILMNRYRQEKSHNHDKEVAIRRAIRKSFRPVLSSSCTTVIGLLMLCFMSLKIGADLGVVLAKGVLCSLLFTYSALPGLLVIFDKGIERSGKPVPILPTDGIARMSEKHRIPISIAFLALFAAAFVLHYNTKISFSTDYVSPIDEVFPKANSIIAVYDNRDEQQIIGLMDTLKGDPHVQTTLSYPSLMLKQLDVNELEMLLATLAPERAAQMNEETIRLACYSVRSRECEPIKLSFSEFAGFLAEQAESDGLISGFIDEQMREEIRLLKDLTSPQQNVPLSPQQSITSPTPGFELEAQPHGPQADDERMGVGEYMRRQAELNPHHESLRLRDLSDADKIRTEMDQKQLSQFLGSSAYQTKMVFSFSGGAKTMSPLRFVHFLSEDLFKRKALAAFVSKEQKEGLELRKKLMDLADRGEKLPVSELDAIYRAFQLEPLPLSSELPDAGAFTEAKSDAHASGESKATTGQECFETQDSLSIAPPAKSAETSQASSGQPSLAGQATQSEQAALDAFEEKNDDPRLLMLMELLDPGLKLSAEQMSVQIRRLGEDIPAPAMKLIYNFYGSTHNYDPSWKVSLSELMDFLTGEMLSDPQLVAMIPENLLGELKSAKTEMEEGLAQLHGEDHSLALIVSDYPGESEETSAFVGRISELFSQELEQDYCLVGESVMYEEMRSGFNAQLKFVTILTVLAIFLVVALTFRSPLIAFFLVMSVMTAVYVNVCASGIGGRTYLYLAYLIVQSILMGSTIDYGILFTNYYRETGSLRKAYKRATPTILTSGLIMIIVPGIIGVAIKDAMVSPIVTSLSIGTLAAVVVVIFLLPAMISTSFKIRQRLRSLLESRLGKHTR
ncbi:MAG: MMPL family transporter [Bacteroidales bacterium]|nr:MMPL family transporter [Bacteroidales bacterium]